MMTYHLRPYPEKDKGWGVYKPPNYI